MTGVLDSLHNFNKGVNFVESEYLSESRIEDVAGFSQNKRHNDSGQTERARPQFTEGGSTNQTIGTELLMSGNRIFGKPN
jgi:hypothetical protein